MKDEKEDGKELGLRYYVPLFGGAFIMGSFCPSIPIAFSVGIAWYFVWTKFLYPMIKE